MNTLILVSYFIIGIISLLWVHSLVGVLDIRRLTITSIFYLAYMAILYVPSIFVGQYMSEPARFRYATAVMSVLITFPLGVTLLNLLTGFHAKEVRKFYEKEILLPSLSIHFKVTYFLVALSAFIIAGFYVLELPRIPLLDMISTPGNRLELALARAEVTKLTTFSLPAHLYALLRNTIFPFLSLTAFGVYYLYKRKMWLLIFAVVTVAGVCYMTLAIQRKDVFLLTAMLFLLYYMFRGGEVKLRFFGVATLGVVAIPYVLTLLRGTRAYLSGVERLWGVLDALLIHRLFVVPADVLSSYFEIFPEVYPHLYGRSSGFLSAVMGWDFFPVARYVAQYRGASSATTNANAAFIGFAYADFGWFWIVLAGILVGCLLQALNVWIIRRRKTLTSYILLVMVAVSSLSFLTTALPTVLLSKGLMVGILLVVAFKIVQTFLRQAVEGPVRG